MSARIGERVKGFKHDKIMMKYSVYNMITYKCKLRRRIYFFTSNTL